MDICALADRPLEATSIALDAKIKTHYGMYSLVYLPFLLGGVACLLSVWFYVQRISAIRAAKNQTFEAEIS